MLLLFEFDAVLRDDLKVRGGTRLAARRDSLSLGALPPELGEVHRSVVRRAASPAFPPALTRPAQLSLLEVVSLSAFLQPCASVGVDRLFHSDHYAALRVFLSPCGSPAAVPGRRSLAHRRRSRPCSLPPSPSSDFAPPLYSFERAQ